MKWWVAFVWIGCAAPPGLQDDSDTDPVADTDTDTDTDEVASPELRSPLEAPDLAPDDPDLVRVRLVAAPHRFEVDGATVDGWAYNGQVPGPTIRLRRGQTLVAEIVNDLPDPTTIHWHGMHVPFAMDGVTWMLDPISPGQTFEARFTADEPGTFWYHPHFDTARQVDLGLYGAIIVEDPDDPPVDSELVAVVDSWNEIDDRDEHHGLDGTRPTLTVNGVRDGVWSVPEQSTARIRWINASNVAYAGLGGDGLRWIGGDQGLRAAPTEGLELLTPGDRAEADLALGGAIQVLAQPWSLYGGELPYEPERLLRVVPQSDAVPPARPSWAFSGASPSSDPPYTDIVYVLHGEPRTGDWRINGERFPDITPERVTLDREAILEVRNLSASEHPFHLHGHAFEVLSRDGEAPAVRQIEDTLNIGLRETVRLRLLADNPGMWMVHCHILPHAEDGMMTVLQVGAPE